MPVTPYVVGQWVRGDKFYGRQGLINEILHGNRNCLWLLGTRRIGKTSILKQLEHLTLSSPGLGYFPLFWDFQGAEEPGDLHEAFGEALFDADERLDELGIPLERVEADDLLGSLGRLRRELRSKNLRLLLLGDEVEELITVHKQAPRFLRRLRRALQSSENIRTVLASKIRLWDLAYEETSTSPFLHGFTPPLFVYGLGDDEARFLICQTKLPPDSRPRFDEGIIETIRARCNNHPYLLQLLCERYLESNQLETAIEDIATDQMVSHFFAVDFEMLTKSERNIIRFIGEHDDATSGSIQQTLALETSSLRDGLQRLEHLGFVLRSPGGSYALANFFFRRWFRELPSNQRMHHGGDNDAPTLRARLDESGDSERRGRLIDNRYELLESLGSGATGEVYKARDNLLHSVIAVKLLKQEYCGDSEALQRLRREVLLARDLSHPNILKVYHLGDEQGQLYVTMQLVKGSDLAILLRDQGPLPIPTVLHLSKRLISALEVAHGSRVLHRDLKPSNILMDGGGEPLISDFGLARLVGGPSITRDGIFVGTPAYASPEQIMGEALDERSDLYALGVVIFELVTGRRPFAGDFVNEVLMMHLNHEPPPPQQVRPEVPEALSQLILRCLAKKPSDRFQSATEMGAAMAAVDSGS